MRISRIHIENYKGVRYAEVDGLDNEPVVLISGKNGSGKTLALEAIVLAWTGYSKSIDRYVGPWGNKATIELEVSFTDGERVAIADWAVSRGQATRDIPSVAKVRRTWSKAGVYGGPDVQEFPIDLVRTEPFRRHHKFGVIDFLSSNRSTSITGQVHSIEFAAMGDLHKEERRKTAIEGFLEHKQGPYLGDVANYLAAADYHDLIALRDNEPQSNEFDALVGRFHEATGKRIGRPIIDPEKGVLIQAVTAQGITHDVHQLSAGEQEALSLLYFVRVLSARGGILLLDEPEQHLHPTLQVALFNLMSEMAGRAQVIAVSHSANLIASMSHRRLLEMRPPGEAKSTQLVHVEKSGERASLFLDLGLRPAAMLQSDALLVVEGNQDESILRNLFPITMSRFRIVVTSGVRGVMQASTTLESVEHALPWLCLRDRDLLSANEVADLLQNHPSLYIWPTRMIENELLDPLLVSTAFSRAGQRITEVEATERLRRFADELREEVLVQSVIGTLSKKYPAPIGSGANTADKLKEYYEKNAEVHAGRVQLVDSVLSEVSNDLDRRWDTEWRILVHGKRLLARLVEGSPFHDLASLTASLTATFADGAAAPDSLVVFHDRLTKLL